MSKNFPKGFKLAGTKCGLKKDDYDLALITSTPMANATAVFTTNKVKAAPVLLTKERIKNKTAAVVINSKNANALTGEKGYKDALDTAAFAGKTLNINEKNILVASTGVIGEPLNMKCIKSGIKSASQNLKDSDNHASYAILTTDRFSKKAKEVVKLGKKETHIFAMAKGAGMIHPKMATMLAFVLTDAKISKSAQKKALKEVCDKTFNRISVDGDTSTNDMLLLLANGEAGNEEIKEGSKEYEKFKKALFNICEHLAILMIRDGEGASKVIQIKVKNAKDKKSAFEIAKSIARSPLVKTAYYGGDPNWGRIIAAAGYANAYFEADQASLWLNKIKVFSKGKKTKYIEKEVAKTMKKERQEAVLDLGFSESFSDTYYFSDLTHAYVTLNSHYRS